MEIDLYDAEGKYIYKCDGWNGIGIQLNPQQTETFKKHCHNMPSEIIEKYNSHKVKVKQRRY